MAADLTPIPPDGQFLIFHDSGRNLQVRLDGETVWLTQRLIAELFQASTPTVNEHLANIYDEGELDPTATIRKFRIVQIEGTRQVSRLVDHYNLDAILAVGYRVRSSTGTAFPPCVRIASLSERRHRPRDASQMAVEETKSYSQQGRLEPLLNCSRLDMWALDLLCSLSPHVGKIKQFVQHERDKRHEQ